MDASRARSKCDPYKEYENSTLNTYSITRFGKLPSIRPPTLSNTLTTSINTRNAINIRNVFDTSKSSNILQSEIITTKIKPSTRRHSSRVTISNIAIGIHGFTSNMPIFTNFFSSNWPNGIVGCLFMIDENVITNNKNNDDNLKDESTDLSTDLSLPIGMKKCEFKEEIIENIMNMKKTKKKTRSSSTNKKKLFYNFLKTKSIKLTSTKWSSTKLNEDQVKLMRIRISSSPIILYKEFPLKAWYVLGDDTTLFNFIPMHQWLKNFDAQDTW